MDTSRGRSRSRSASGSRAVRARSRSRSMSVTRIPRLLGLRGVHKFERTISCPFSLNVSTGFSDISTGVPVAQGKFLSLQYSLQSVGILGSAGTINVNVPTSTDFTNLFDQWRIDGVEIRMVCTTDSAPTNGVSHPMPIIWCFNDYDDGVVPTTTNQFLEREGMRIISFADTNIKTHRCTPKVANVVFQGGVVPAYSLGNKYQWIDIAYPQTQYYSTKLYYDTVGLTAANPTGNINFLVKLKMSFKGVR